MRGAGRSRARQWVLELLVCGGIALLGIGGYAAWRYDQMGARGNEPQPRAVEVPWQATVSPPPVGAAEATSPGEPFTVAVLGIDSRGERRSRADTVMVAAINPRTRRAYVVSIPRDTYVHIPGRGPDKLNHAMAYGGPVLVKATLERLLVLPIHHYVVVDFAGFRRLVDELGGVEVNVAKPMKYHDPADGTTIDLYPGRQVLNGDQALGYVRYRLSDVGRSDSDFERIRRQQEVLRALADKANDLRTWLHLFAVLNILRDHVHTDLTTAQVFRLARAFAGGVSEKSLQLDTLRGEDRLVRTSRGRRVWYTFVSERTRRAAAAQLRAVLEGEAHQGEPRKTEGEPERQSRSRARAEG
ncbi:LCP family protein [Calditerricola satsumensis]|uniref:Cell envelope-related transcriptional attenuator domain-containing protein n=1 Tax=Calditerricola satsumensis TaxID=373054 RepID=A0A8J3B2P6_9BACI|nr:LCP family protein [Calditerricola satsumensis]GGJ91167.1 hypothetical protein GCM10007043_01100 [Calditerricola satsumensis]